MPNVPVLYEDNHLLVVEKPCNMPVQADSSGDLDLLTQLKRYIKETYHKPGEVYLALVHRLDRPVGGVVVFARTSKAAARLCAQFAGHGAQKKYFAITCGPAPNGELTDWLLKDGITGSARTVQEGTPNAKAARLTCRPLQQSEGGLTLAEVALHTGRHHQIRVQLASRGAALWGDQRYNPAAKRGQQLALWAYSLTIEHPSLHTRMTFTSLPQGGVWEPFAPALAAAAGGIRVLYQDANILAVHKPAGLPVALADGGEDTLEGRLNALYGKVYPLHRLDAHTTGLTLFAKTPAAEAELCDAFRTHAVHKTYLCVVKGAPHPPAADCTAYALKDAGKARVTVYNSPLPGGKEMRTAYRTLQRKGGESLLEITLHTGRTHQIRAHMAHMGCPLLGDDKYGDRDWNRARKLYTPRLCAVRLQFMLPPDSVLAYLNEITLETQPEWAF
ncbi:MAG: RluA family pseudouridine synthase [Christensenellaceae bacterium]|jgi:23S rRNA pseudouridine1911/1915/1917 synthase|nr:RluA family pseudouridine synthase [Christensenellaceae bacterium]